MKLRVNKKHFKAAVYIVGIILTVSLILILIHKWEVNRETEPVSSDASSLYADDTRELTYYNGNWYAKRDDIETILILGVDKFASSDDSASYNNSQQADFLILLILDSAAQHAVALQLNRDTMTEIAMLGVNGEPAGSFQGHLALAHTYGSGREDSCENTVKAVSNLLFGIEINHYLSFTMDAVALVNDLVGGVQVEVLDDLTFLDPALRKGETVTLKGEQALHYVRTRKGLEDSTNLHRMKRQQQYLAALRQQVDACSMDDPEFGAKVVAAVSPYMVSDCTVNQLLDLAEVMNHTQYSEELLEIPGEAVVGEEFIEFYPDETALQELVVSLFYTETKVE